MTISLYFLSTTARDALADVNEQILVKKQVKNTKPAESHSAVKSMKSAESHPEAH